MKRILLSFLVVPAAMLVVGLAGCSDGPSGDPNQLAAARDAQGQAQAAQRAGMAGSRGAGSVDAAAKAGKK